MNYYPHHIGDYAAATEHLTWVQDMAYTRLLRLYYRTEKPIPRDVLVVARLLKAMSPPQVRAIQQVLEEFFTLQDDGWHQKRCDEEIAEFQAKSAKAARSASERWKKQSMRTHSERIANAVQSQCEGNANQNQNHNQNKSSAIPPVDNSTSIARAGQTGAAAAALRTLGVEITPANPLLLDWLGSGATEAQLAEAVARARLHKPAPERIPARYLDPIVREVLAGPQARAPTAREPAWWTTEQATTAKAAELGLYPRGGEGWSEFRERIRAALAAKAKVA